LERIRACDADSYIFLDSHNRGYLGDMVMKFIWTDRHGQEFLVDPISSSTRYNDGPVLAHHRLIAYAYGLIDDLFEPVEIDHEIEISWLNYIENLDPKEPEDHAKFTRRREYKRKNGTREV